MKLRIRYSKHGRVRYIGHLDTQRYFQRVNRRAGLAVLYSGGFSPHQKMSFAMPLSVGYESDAEYFDLEVEHASSSAEVIEAMNREMAEGISVSKCVMLPDNCENAMASVRYADYLVTFKKGKEPSFDIEKAVSLVKESSELIILKEVKKAKRSRKNRDPGESPEEKTEIILRNGREYRPLDIRQNIHEIAVRDGGIFMRVSAGSRDNIKPEPVISAICEREGSILPELSLNVLRCELYSEGFVSLLDHGVSF